MQLNGNTLTICVEKSVPSWLYTKHKSLIVPNSTTSSVDNVGNAFVWVIIPRGWEGRLQNRFTLYIERACVCVCVCVSVCLSVWNRMRERLMMLKFPVRWAHATIIKEHDLKVATVSNIWNTLYIVASHHILKIN